MLLSQSFRGDLQRDSVDYFVHLDPNHQIYFRIPRGFPKSGTNQVLKPERSVYGFRQAPTAFKDKLTAFMLLLNALLLRMQVQLGFCEGALKF